MTEHANDDLAFTIAFALSRQKGTLRRVPKHDSIPHLTPVAKAIIRQMELSGWRVTKRPPREAHSTHGSTGAPTRPDHGQDGPD